MGKPKLALPKTGRHVNPKLTARTINVRDTKYQPSKAEKEEVIVLRRKDGTPPTPKELAESMRPVEVVYEK